MNKSKLTSNQYRTYTKWLNKHEVLTVTARYDDQCGNGHNSFSLTAELKDTHLRRDGGIVACGCMHDEIAEHFPELKPLIKWHLASSDGPMHYVANTMYHAKGISKHQDQWFVYLENEQLGISRTLLGIMNSEQWENACIRYPFKDLSRKENFNSMAKPADLGAARRCAIWQDASLEDLQSKEKLLARLPKLLEEFREDMESLGFTW